MGASLWAARRSPPAPSSKGSGEPEGAMSFGKRGQPQPTPAGEPPATAPPAPRPSVLMKQLRGIGLGIALALGIYLAYCAGMRALGHALAAKWNAGNGVVWTAILPATEG